jgi:starch synthase
MFRNKDQWRKVQSSCVYQDFSWGRSASRYIALYAGLTGAKA